MSSGPLWWLSHSGGLCVEKTSRYFDSIDWRVGQVVLHVTTAMTRPDESRLNLFLSPALLCRRWRTVCRQVTAPRITPSHPLLLPFETATFLQNTITLILFHDHSRCLTVIFAPSCLAHIPFFTRQPTGTQTTTPQLHHQSAPKTSIKRHPSLGAAIPRDDGPPPPSPPAAVPEDRQP